MISTINEPRGTFTCRSSTLVVFADTGTFRRLLLIVLGSRSDLHDWRPPRCVYVSVINTHNFGRFWSVSCNISHRFGVLQRFPRLTIPGVRLRVRRQHSSFWPILSRFMDYYSPFCEPEAISIVVELHGAFMCRSSTLAVLADSGPFRGLLLTVLGSRSDFHD